MTSRPAYDTMRGVVTNLRASEARVRIFFSELPRGEAVGWEAAAARVSDALVCGISGGETFDRVWNFECEVDGQLVKGQSLGAMTFEDCDEMIFIGKAGVKAFLAVAAARPADRTL